MCGKYPADLLADELLVGTLGNADAKPCRRQVIPIDFGVFNPSNAKEVVP